MPTNVQGCTVDCPDNCNIAHKRMALEQRVIRRLIREALKDGWRPFAVDNGEEIILTPNLTSVLTEVFSVDCSAIRFRHTTLNRRSFVDVVLGNGVDCLPDCGESMSVTYDRVSDIVEGWE